jgi:hypothetical protein
MDGLPAAEEEDCANIFAADDDDGPVALVPKTEDVVACEDSLIMVPAELVEEEAKVRARNEEEAARDAAAQRPDDLSKAERYEKLMDLLGKSAIYSNYLLEKMTVGDEASALKKKKLEDRKHLKQKVRASLLLLALPRRCSLSSFPPCRCPRRIRSSPRPAAAARRGRPRRTRRRCSPRSPAPRRPSRRTASSRARTSPTSSPSS